MTNLIYYIGTLFLLTIIMPYTFADDGKPIHVSILDSYSQVSLQSNLTIDSVKQKNIISAIQDSFDFQYEDLDSLMSVSYGGNTDFVEKSSTIATSSNCQTEIVSKLSFTVDSIDIDSIFLEIIVSDRLSKSSLSQSLILQSTDPENWTITAVTQKQETKVQMLHCNERLTEFISSDIEAEIISKLVQVIGLKGSQISEIWNYENKDLVEKIYTGATYEEIIEAGEQIMIDAAANQMKLEETLETVQTGEGEIAGCLIATATYGSELAPQVQQLREIRDNIVMNTDSGISFMAGFNQLYYSFSPTIADWERQNPIFQEAVRVFITPMISSLSIMTLANGNSDVQVLGLGISVITLNIGMYVVAPTFAVFKVHKHFKSRK